jgi:hypothetical protein
MNCTLAELFNTGEDFKEIHSIDKSLIEKVTILENLDEEERKGIYSIIDGLSTKQKLKKTLSNVLAI